MMSLTVLGLAPYWHDHTLSGLAGTWQPCSRLLFGSSDPFKAHIRIKAVGQSAGWPAHPPAFCMAPGF